MFRSDCVYNWSRPGSLMLRPSYPMQYDPAVLNDEWYEFCQSNPKDYDVTKVDLKKRNLFLSTYKDLGWLPTTIPNSVTRDAMEECKQWPAYERPVRPPMVNIGNFGGILLGDKDCVDHHPALKKLMERHHIDCIKNPKSVTRSDFEFPSRIGKTPQETPDWTPASPPWMLHKKCHSHFTDTCDHRHSGIRTWNDESEKYANTPLKREYFPLVNTLEHV